MSNYSYQPLEAPRNIRLLKLLPKEDNGSIATKLITASLDEQTNYYPLSYVWGDERNKVKIGCDDKDHYITGNLFSFLGRLCGSDEKDL